MKTRYSIYLVLFAALAFNCSCSSAGKDPNVPKWLTDAPPEGVIWGIGTAKLSLDQLSEATAEARARTSIVRQLNANVEIMISDYMQEAGLVGDQTAISFQEEVSRQVNSLQLNGARTVKQWKAPDDTWWILVEYKITDAKAAISAVLTDETVLFAEFKLEEALRRLDAQLINK
jgi:hypothetical protein